MATWTKEQQDAINARGVSIIVSAAAGSGKTSVLISRLISQLADTENKISAEKMVIVTFTKDAAAEMKQRLTIALSELIENQPENEWLIQQQLMLQSAKISTIHSFCFDLIKENIQEFELSSGFRIIEETEENLIKNKALQTVFEDFYQNKPSQMEKLYKYFCYKNDKPLENIILDIHNYISSIPYSEKWLEDSQKNYIYEDFINSDFISKYLENILNTAEYSVALVKEAVLALSETNQTKKVEQLTEEFVAIDLISSLLKNKELSLEEKLIKIEKPEFKRLTFAKGDEEITEKVKELRNLYKKKVSDVIGDIGFLNNIKRDVNSHYEIIGCITDIIKNLNKEIWNIKKEKNSVGFSDAEQLTVKLLSFIDENGNIVKSKIAHEISNYVQIIMIDEFQDTNNNQNLIFKLLSHDGTADAAGKNMFVVGDIKQSIYRFRLANPKNFIDFINKSVPYQDKTDKNSYIKLNKNFRSSRETVDFVNYIFENIMSEKIGDIEYNEEEKLINGAIFPDEIEKNTEIVIIDTLNLEENINHEVIYTVKKINEMLRNSHPVCDKGTIRPCTKRDFCILLRSKKMTNLFLKEFEKYNIEVFSEETPGYLKSREISILLNLLTVIDNPLIDTALTSVMLSPMFMMNADEVSTIRLLNKESTMYDAMLLAIDEKEESVDEKIKYKLKNVYNSLIKFRKYSACCTLEELIKKIYDNTDFLSVVQIYKDGNKKKANLRVLLEYARLYEQSSNDGLTGFLRYIENIKRLNGDLRQGSTISSSEDAVMIKTIHKSKGLEFPFVFLCGTSLNFNMQDSMKKVQLNFDYGIGFKLQNIETFEKFNTIPYKVIDSINRKDSLSEEMRLMYVALTRAKDKIFIPLSIEKKDITKINDYISFVKKNKTINPFLSSSANCMKDWLLMCLIFHKDAQILHEMFDVPLETLLPYDFNINFYNYIYEDEMVIEKEEVKNISINNDYIVQLENQINYNYDEFLMGLKSKITVSDLTKTKSKYANEDFKRPNFLREKTNLTGSEKGTALHSFMQFIDFKKLDNSLENEIIRLTEKGYLTDKQAKSLNINKINKFTESDIYNRICKSSNIKREKNFLVKIADINIVDDYLENYKGTEGILQGVIDLYFEEDDGLILIDYKTDYAKNDEELIDKYKQQILLYKSALEIIEEKTVKETYIYSFYLEKFIRI